MISHTNSGSVAFWRSTEEKEDYLLNTWRTLPEDKTARKRPTEDTAIAIIQLKEKGEWLDVQYKTL